MLLFLLFPTPNSGARRFVYVITGQVLKIGSQPCTESFSQTHLLDAMHVNCQTQTPPYF